MPSDALNEFTTQLVVAGLISYALEALKRSPWFPWVTMESRRVNRIVAAVCALAATVGIQFQYDPTAGVLMISGLTVDGLKHGLWDYAKQFIFQQAWFDGIVSRTRQPVEPKGGDQ